MAEKATPPIRRQRRQQASTQFNQQQQQQQPKSQKSQHQQQDQQPQQGQNSRRMSMFGLRIETRDEYDAENYHDFKNIRREIKDKTHTYRIGPAPITDFQTKPKHYVISSPGSLDSDLDEGGVDAFGGKVSGSNDPPYPTTKETTIGTLDQQQQKQQPTHLSKAGCRSLISYFAKLGRHEGDEFIDLEFVDSLLRAGKSVSDIILSKSIFGVICIFYLNEPNKFNIQINSY